MPKQGLSISSSNPSEFLKKALKPFGSMHLSQISSDNGKSGINSDEPERKK